MAEILQKAFQNAIDKQSEMKDKKSQNTPTIDSVIGTGPDIIQPPKTEVKEVVSDEGADDQEASATEAKVPESEQRMSPVITTPAEPNTSNPTKPTENDAENDVTSTVEDPEVTVAVAAESKSSDGTAEGSVEDNKSSDATVLMSVQANKSSDGSAEVPQCEVSQPLSVDQMVPALKRKIAVAAAERKSLYGTGEGSVGDNKSSDATVVMSTEHNKSLACSAEGSVEDNQSSHASA